MKRMMLSHWIIIAPLSVGLSLAGCDKNHSSGRDIDMLTHTTWKYEKAGFDSDNDGVFDALDPRIAGCERDNTIIFRVDGTGSMQEGAIKCKPSDPDSLPFVWSLQDNDSTIYFQNQYYKIRELTDNRLELYADENLGGVSTRYIIVLKH
jgi:lipocalin-like protein